MRSGFLTQPWLANLHLDIFPFFNYLAVAETQMIKPSVFNQMQKLVSLEGAVDNMSALPWLFKMCH